MPFSVPDNEAVTDDPAQLPASGSTAPVAPAADPAASTAAQAATSPAFSTPASELLDANGSTPMQAGRAYLNAAGDNLPASIDQTLPWQQQAEQHYQNAKTFWNESPLTRLDNSVAQSWAQVRANPLVAAGQAWNATGNAVGGLWQRAKQGTADAWNQTTQDFADHPLRAPADLLASATVGGLQGLYGLGKLASEGVGKVTDAAAGVVAASGGDPDSAGRYRAYRDFLLRSYNQNVDAPTEADIRSASPLPAVQDAAEQIAPAFVPVAGEEGLVAKGADLLASGVPKVGGRLLQGTGKLAEMAADKAPVLSTGAAFHAMTNGGVLHAVGDLAAGAAAKYAKPLATGLKNYGAGLITAGPSTLVSQVAGPLLTTGLRAGTAAVVDDQNVPAQVPFTAPPEELVAN